MIAYYTQELLELKFVVSLPNILIKNPMVSKHGIIVMKILMFHF